MSCYARWMHATMLACCAVCMFCLVVIALRFYVAYSIVSCNVLSRIDSKEFKSTPAYCCLNCAFPNHCGMRLYISRALSYNFTQQIEMCAIARAQPVNTTQKQKKIADLHRKRVTNQSKWKWDFRFDATCSQPANDDAIWQENAMWLCGPIILVSAWHLMFGDSRPPKKCDMLSTSNRRKHTQRLAIS